MNDGLHDALLELLNALLELEVTLAADPQTTATAPAVGSALDALSDLYRRPIDTRSMAIVAHDFGPVLDVLEADFASATAARALQQVRRRNDELARIVRRDVLMS